MLWERRYRRKGARECRGGGKSTGTAEQKVNIKESRGDERGGVLMQAKIDKCMLKGAGVAKNMCMLLAVACVFVCRNYMYYLHGCLDLEWCVC